MIIHKSIKNNSSLLLSGTGLFLIVASMFLIPKVSARFDSPMHAQKLTNFMQTVEAKKMISSQSFWEFREFYSPGYFRVEKNGIKIPHSDLPFVKVSTPLPFSIFTAPKTKSYDFLVSQNTLATYISNPYAQILVQTPSLLISQNHKTTLITFILPTTDLLKANGFFKSSEDNKLLEGKYWMDVTILRKN